MEALILIDVQNDFMKHGALEVPKASQIIPVIHAIQSSFPVVVATQDWHPPNHKSFASNHPGCRPFDSIEWHGTTQILWPDHCIQGSHGAEFNAELDLRPVQAIFRKGMDSEIDSYSAFYDNQHQNNTGLLGYLVDKQVKRLYFCGLAADVCVYFSIKDALSEGFECCLIEDAVMPLDVSAYQSVKQELKDAGVRMIQSKNRLIQ